MRLVCLLLLLAANAAAGQEVQVEFDMMDLDGDGYVSLAEAAGNADVVTRFDRADRDRDGRLSPKEFARLDKIKVRLAKTRRERVRTAVARDARAAEREAVVDVAGSAGAGASAKPGSP